MATRKAGPVGREDVLDGLRRVVDQAVAGRGQIMLLAGEAALGRSAVAADDQLGGIKKDRACLLPSSRELSRLRAVGLT